jgi:hypothetical protein
MDALTIQADHTPGACDEASPKSVSLVRQRCLGCEPVAANAFAGSEEWLGLPTSQTSKLQQAVNVYLQ